MALYGHESSNKYPEEWENVLRGAQELMEIRLKKHAYLENEWNDKLDEKVSNFLDKMMHGYDSGSMSDGMLNVLRGISRIDDSCFVKSENLVNLVYQVAAR